MNDGMGIDAADSDLELSTSDGGLDTDEELEQRETEAEKRLRLAKQYIDRLRTETAPGDDEVDAADLDRDIIADRLREDALESIGKLYRKVVDQLVFPVDEDKIKSFRGHQLSVTCVAVSSNGQYLYSGSKDGSIVKWDLFASKKIKVISGGRKGTKNYPGHTDQVMALAISSDDKYMASGGRDRVIHIWSVADDTLLTTFRHHKDGISGLAFRKGANQLYSASLDRSVKVWNIDQLSYIETLFGHQDVITGIDTLSKEQCITVGARDRTLRIWKIPDETQLVFRGGGTGVKKSEEINDKADLPIEGSMDCVALLNEEYSVTGGDSGLLALWHIGRKRPLYTCPMAHGVDEESGCDQPRWITAVAALPYSDLFASGSWDGSVKLWKLSDDKRSFSLHATISMPGFVNALQFAEFQNTKILDATTIQLVVGLGQEPKNGRWLRLPKAKNTTRTVQFTWKEGATIPQVAALRQNSKRQRRNGNDMDSDDGGLDIADL
ncbi:WD40-repeat-containing domain protein [Syncephalis fuscata]|nr:WD40-repeat-containing domain protein [Syncephalis fuscata]